MKLDKMKFAKLIAYIAGIVLRKDIDETDLKVLDDLIDIDVPREQYVSIELVDKLLRQIKNRQKILAIKSYRDLTGADLKQSKYVIDAFWAVEEKVDTVGYTLLRVASEDTNTLNRGG